MAPAIAAPAPTDPRPPTPTPGRGSLGLWILLGLGLLLGSVLIALTIGPAAITPADVLGSAWHHSLTWLAERGVPITPAENPLTTIRDAIVWQGRAPRLLTATCVGAGLALCGAVMQAITRNPLADPYLLGVSSGAALGAVAVLLLGVAIALPIAAFAGALLALGATLALAGIGGRLTPARTILAGIAVAQACSALVSFVIFSTAQGDSYREIINWLMGSLAAATWTSVAISGAAVVIIGALVLAHGRSLDAFAFGDTAATSLGVHVPRTRWLLLTLTALLTGALVSVSGSIGFVGLVLPHVVRLLVGARHVRLLPLAALGGAVFLVWADTGARTIFEPSEVPVGILTAAIGAPVFAWLLLRNRGNS
ncbi:putative F420-0 ABC transporter permease subunit [Ruania alkalisoli]|uniref:putative F420-0 ABC transporter permease subunit n=1 Tax=Ruania alkalisoli TaxID=2779775 RepID=UPI003CCDA156